MEFCDCSPYFYVAFCILHAFHRLLQQEHQNMSSLHLSTGQSCRPPLYSLLLNPVTSHTQEAPVMCSPHVCCCAHICHFLWLSATNMLQSRFLSWQQILFQCAGLVSFCTADCFFPTDTLNELFEWRLLNQGERLKLLTRKYVLIMRMKMIIIRWGTPEIGV